MRAHTRVTAWLIGGDALAILVLSVAGYLSHYAGQEAFTFRWLSTFLPFWLGWVLAAMLGGMYRAEIAARWQSAAWRAVIAGALAAPFATMLRGLYLNAAVAPIFMIVLTATAALAMSIWRLFWAWLAQRKILYG
jgi:glucose uptake protein GlcU